MFLYKLLLLGLQFFFHLVWLLFFILNSLFFCYFVFNPPFFIILFFVYFIILFFVNFIMLFYTSFDFYISDCFNIFSYDQFSSFFILFWDLKIFKYTLSDNFLYQCLISYIRFFSLFPLFGLLYNKINYK